MFSELLIVAQLFGAILHQPRLRHGLVAGQPTVSAMVWEYVISRLVLLHTLKKACASLVASIVSRPAARACTPIRAHFLVALVIPSPLHSVDAGWFTLASLHSAPQGEARSSLA